MSIKFLKEYGFPCDLMLNCEPSELNYGRYRITVYMNNKKIDSYTTNRPMESRKDYSRGFFAAIKKIT